VANAVGGRPADASDRPERPSGEEPAAHEGQRQRDEADRADGAGERPHLAPCVRHVAAHEHDDAAGRGDDDLATTGAVAARRRGGRRLARVGIRRRDQLPVGRPDRVVRRALSGSAEVARRAGWQLEVEGAVGSRPYRRGDDRRPRPEVERDLTDERAPVDKADRGAERADHEHQNQGVPGEQAAAQ